MAGCWVPTYRAIDRKPENGFEIKTSAFSRSDKMLRLVVVKSPNDHIECDTNAGLNHRALTSRRLVEPSKNSNRIVCGDSLLRNWSTLDPHVGQALNPVVDTRRC